MAPAELAKIVLLVLDRLPFRQRLVKGVCIKHLVVVEGVDIISERTVESHRLINCEDDTRELGYVDKKTKDFMEKVIKANLDLVKGYNGKQDRG
jgi:hypothetical protein